MNKRTRPNGTTPPREHFHTNSESDNTPLSPDPVALVRQFELDETLARTLQAQFSESPRTSSTYNDQSEVANSGVVQQQREVFHPNVVSLSFSLPTVELPHRSFHQRLDFSGTLGALGEVRREVSSMIHDLIGSNRISFPTLPIPIWRGRSSDRSESGESLNQSSNFDINGGNDTDHSENFEDGDDGENFEDRDDAENFDDGDDEDHSEIENDSDDNDEEYSTPEATTEDETEEEDVEDDFNDLVGFHEHENIGLEEYELNMLPTREFSRPRLVAGDSSDGDHKSTEASKKECQVCMSEYEKGNILRILPCFHEFHRDCIDKWFEQHNTCPVCREIVDVL